MASRKKLYIIAASAIFALLLFLASALIIANASDGHEDPSKMAYTVTYSEAYPVENPPFNVPTLSVEQIQRLCAKPSMNILPGSIKEKIESYAKKMIREGGLFIIIWSERDCDGVWHVLLAVDPDGGNFSNAEHFEVMAEGEKVELVTLKPELVEFSADSRELAEYEADNEKETAEVIVSNFVEGYRITLQTGSTLGWYYAGYTIEGKNIFGWTLWKLTAAGYFYLNEPYVLDVINASEVWAQSWLGWSVDYFSSDISFHPYMLWGQVNAYAGFAGPLQYVNAWSWVRMYGDGTYLGNAGTY